jgi:transcriptional regulator with XRE-family HTH domain
MKASFATILSSLRRESNLSQKKAADSLGISQALLSHYENGVREPKLDFIAKACDYYGVTTDYILGRTSERSQDGVSIPVRRTDERRIAGAASLLVAMLAEIGDDALSESVTSYLNFCLYTVISTLRMPTKTYDPLFDAALKKAEAAFLINVRRMTRDRAPAKKLSDELLQERHPEQFAAVLELEEVIRKAVSNLSQNKTGV